MPLSRTRNRWWIALVAVLIFAIPAADALARGGSSGGSRSSGGSSSGGSKSSGGSSGSSSSGGSRSSAPKSTGSSRRASPSSNPAVRQPTSAHLIPKSFRTRGSLPPKARRAMKGKRNIGADKRALRRRPGRFLDPYSPRYYGLPTSAYFYLFLAARDDDDPQNPRRPQQCLDWNEEEDYCEDFVTEDSSCGGTGMIPVVSLGLIGLGGYGRRRTRSRSKTTDQQSG